MKIALICGGPSLERGISLNSARSVLDHLAGDGIEIVPIYFDQKRHAYRISTAQLYSNTPSDFDFKLQQTAKFLSKKALKHLLKSVDLTFPVVHGAFGEDGTLLRMLEQYKIPFIGSDSEACKRCFDKYDSNHLLQENGFFTLPSALLKIYHNDHKAIIDAFFKTHRLKRAIVKPSAGGSSIGVFSVSTPEEAFEKANLLFSKRMDTRVVIEPFCEGIEFTVIILQSRFGLPVAILPTEKEMDYGKNQIFDFRRKYLPSNHVKYHCPPRFSNESIERIQIQAEQLFNLLGMRDFARFDGWLLGDGNIWFSDFNPVSGMEQNSFLFQQASRIGLSHRDLLRTVVQNACRRYGMVLPERPKAPLKRKSVHVLFGGNTAERQVSLMTGTNAWLKLRRSKRYEPTPFLLDLKGNVWKIPYALALNHTVEEILENCEKALESEQRLNALVEKVRWRLSLEKNEFKEPFFLPEKMSLSTFIKRAPFVFSGLHGGIGEDGTLQRRWREAGVLFNGPGEKISAICMDKHRTAQALKGLEKEGIFTAPQKSVPLKALKSLQGKLLEKFWKELLKTLGSRTIIVKPQADGCSAGVVRLYDPKDLKKYLHFALRGERNIPAGTFKKHPGIIEMPLTTMKSVLFERFIETDHVRVKGNRLKWNRKTGWIEVTIGVLEEKGIVRALNPSLTVAEGEVLSVEEKFQGGTGVNMTPPPEIIVKPAILKKAKQSIERVCQVLGITGYSRIDAFLKGDTGDLIIIEVNTTPALTPSTVFFHQGLAESNPLYPTPLIERLITNTGY